MIVVVVVSGDGGAGVNDVGKKYEFLAFENSERIIFLLLFL